MEMFWAASFHNSAAKHLSTMQTTHLNFNSDNQMNMDDLGGDDDTRTYFPCPYCYLEIELRALCIHLQEEHCFALKNAVCPLCAANLGKDPLGHFTIQHSHCVKRKRKSQKSGYWSSCPTTTSKDWREMSYAPDPLLSPFLCSVTPHSDPKAAEQEDKVPSTTTSPVANITRLPKPSAVQEQDYEERVHRAALAQELILSTIL